MHADMNRFVVKHMELVCFFVLSATAAARRKSNQGALDDGDVGVA